MMSTRRLIAVVLTVILVFSLAAVASAATVTYGSYTFNVTSSGSTTSSAQVNDVTVAHVYGTTNTISYIAVQKTVSFNSSQFPEAQRVKLLEAYAQEGLSQTYTRAYEEGTVTVAYYRATGTYYAGVVYTHLTGSWAVAVDGTRTSSGTFTSAPVTHTFEALMR